MRKFLRCNRGQTIIEYALVLTFFATVFTISIPPLRDATVNAYQRIADQMEPGFAGGIPGWPPSNDDGSGDSGEPAPPWFPPELDMTDPNVIYSVTNITLTGSSKIYGNVIANGKVSTGPSPNCFIEGQIVEFAEYDFYFPLPQFPSIPKENFTNRGALYLSGGVPVTTISESGYYSTLEVAANRELTFNTGNEGDVLTIVADNFNIFQGKLNVEGEGRLVLMVNDSFAFGGSSYLDALPANVSLYYAGNNPLQFYGSTRFNGNIYAEKAGAGFGGSTTVAGNIILGGTSVNVSEGGAANLNDALLYAPNADLRVVGTASIEGRIIANNIEGIGNATIRFKPVLLSDEFFWDILNPDGEP